MLRFKKRAFGLDYSLHTSLLQVMADCTWGEGLVDDIFESFGDLNCIFCLSTGDKMKSMSNIGRGKFGWATATGLLKLRTLFGAESRDGRDMNTSGGCYGMSRMAGIKPGEDDVL